MDAMAMPTIFDYARWLLLDAARSAFIWLPLVFTAYAVGRKRLSFWFFFSLTAAEAIAVLVSMWNSHSNW